MPLSSLPAGMDWGEAVRMTLVLAGDPTSQICAALSEWKHPLSWEGIALRHLFDLQHASKSKHRPKPYGMPWDRPKKKYGSRGMTPEQYEAIRARHRDN